MNSRSSFCFSFLFFVLIQAPIVSSNPQLFYETCGKTFSCGDNITGIGYPFRGIDDPPYCGHPSFVLTCDDHNATNINIANTWYRVLAIDEDIRTMTIAREDVMEEICSTEMMNTTLDHSVFDYGESCRNFTFFYGCPFIPGLTQIHCGENPIYVIPGNFGPGICNASVTVPGTSIESGGPAVNVTELDRDLQQGFQIKWKVDSKTCSLCTASKGRCGYEMGTNRTVCYCPDPPYIADACEVALTASPAPDKTQSPKDKIHDNRFGLVKEVVHPLEN